MGTEGNSARPHARRLPAAVAPALCGVAAAFALAGVSAAGASASTAPAASVMTHHRPAAVVARPPAPATLVSVTRPATRHAAPAPASYTVRPGDTLSAIAQRFYHSPDFWPVIFWANHKTIRYANEIQVGQKLTIPAKPASVPAAPPVLAPAPTPGRSAPVRASDEQTRRAPAEAAPAAPAPSAPAPATVSTAGDSAFQACVIARESGGNSQVMNSSGHYGLYQFSASTWAAYGGNPSDFGHATVAQQNQVFNNAIAAGGQSNWSAYDGC